MLYDRRIVKYAVEISSEALLINHAAFGCAVLKTYEGSVCIGMSHVYLIPFANAVVVEKPEIYLTGCLFPTDYCSDRQQS